MRSRVTTLVMLLTGFLAITLIGIWQRDPIKGLLNEEPYRLISTPGDSMDPKGWDVYYFFGDSAKIGKRLERELKGQLGWTREPFSNAQEATWRHWSGNTLGYYAYPVGQFAPTGATCCVIYSHLP